jgi:aminoglycoside 6-adenylyltransferase
MYIQRDAIQQQQVCDLLIRWAEKQELIRAMLLYSSRANPEASVDSFSDYDILLAVTDVRHFHQDDRWLGDFGRVLVVFRNPIGLHLGFESFGFVTHYEEGVKIDYGFFPVDYLAWAAKQTRLPDELDNGYQVLLDKDRLTEGLKPPTYRAYLPSPPTQREYRELVEEFFNDSIYVAKHLWRDNLFPLKLSLDEIMKMRCLRQMLEWQVGIEHNWRVKPGAYGKGLKKQVAPEIWTELEATYVGAGREENWEALFKTIRLFRKVALRVAGRLAYEYPQDMDQRVVAYLDRLRGLDPETEFFSHHT